jgi:hypothetical protein
MMIILTLNLLYAIMLSSIAVSRENSSMSRLVVKTGTVVIALLLGLGWAWTGILKDQGYINSGQQQNILIFLTFLLAAQQIYLVIPKPVKTKIVDQRESIIVNELTYFLERYYDKIEELQRKHEVLPTVRINVMLPTKRFRGVLGTYLKIYYYRCPDKVIYTTEEFSNKWKFGEGTCGAAWKSNKNAIFDSETPEYQLRIKNIKKGKLPSIQSIKCSLSVPIVLDGSVVGVLNLDSKSNLDDTLFLDYDVLVLIGACATTLSGQFFEDGVEGK